MMDSGAQQSASMAQQSRCGILSPGPETPSTGSPSEDSAGLVSPSLGFVEMIETMRKGSAVVRPPTHENDVKERAKEMLFGFHEYEEHCETYLPSDFREHVYIPKWYLGMLGLGIETDETRAYRRNPSLKRACGDYLIAPNPFYFDYDKYALKPADILRSDAGGFRLCCYWVHPVLQELSPFFIEKFPHGRSSRPLTSAAGAGNSTGVSPRLKKRKLEFGFLDDSRSDTLAPTSTSAGASVAVDGACTSRSVPVSFLDQLIRSRDENGVCTLKASESTLMYDKSRSIEIDELDAYDSSGRYGKYLFSWKDLNGSDVDTLKTLREGVRSYLQEVFEMPRSDVDKLEMVFHTTTKIRNPAFYPSDRGQFMHLHLQVYADGYLPSMSCMQRSMDLDILIAYLGDLEAAGDVHTRAGLRFPIRYFDESEGEDAVRARLERDGKCSRLSTTRLFAEQQILLGAVSGCVESLAQNMSTLANYYGLTPFFSDFVDADKAKKSYGGAATPMSWETVMDICRQSFCGASWGANWTLDARRRKTPPKLHLVFGCKGSGKSTYTDAIEKRVEHGGSGQPPCFIVDGSRSGIHVLDGPPQRRFDFKVQLLLWGISRGIDIVFPTTRWRTVDEVCAHLQCALLAHSEGARAPRHDLPYRIHLHCVLASYRKCRERALARARPGDSWTLSEADHRSLYLAPVQNLLEQKRGSGIPGRGTSTVPAGRDLMETLTLVNNDHDQNAVADGGVDLGVGAVSVSISHDVTMVAEANAMAEPHTEHVTPVEASRRVVRDFMHNIFAPAFDFPPLMFALEEEHARSIVPHVSLPRCIIVRGPPGAGKTTLLRKLGCGDKRGPLMAAPGANAIPREQQNQGGAEKDWIAVDGDFFCGAYRDAWAMDGADSSICSAGVRRAVRTWKATSVEQALAENRSFVYPITGDNELAAEIAGGAMKKGWGVVMCVILVAPQICAKRLLDRNSRQGTPLFSRAEYDACYAGIEAQFCPDRRPAGDANDTSRERKQNLTWDIVVLDEAQTRLHTGDAGRAAITAFRRSVVAQVLTESVGGELPSSAGG